MTNAQKEILYRVNAYAENVLGDIDPQKVPISYQLEKLKPIMQEIADEMNISLEDFFIMYMDLTTEATVLTNNKLKDELKDLGDGTNPILFR